MLAGHVPVEETIGSTRGFWHQDFMDAISSKQPTVENTYNQMTGYGFARRYVEGKVVAVIGRDGLGYGAGLLAETAKSVTGLTDSSGVVGLASTAHPYEHVSLPDLPYPDGSFDVVVALQIIEKLNHPEDLVREARRVLKRDGVLIISTPDKQTHSNDRNYDNPDHKSEMYAPEFREMLGRHFERVRLYRQGTVAGGLIFGSTERLSVESVESAPFYSADPSFGVEPPVTQSVVAVCGGSEAPEHENPQPYLLLDRDRRIFDEHDAHREDVELLRGEIRQMQETEVQAFHETLEARNHEIRRLRARERELSDLTQKLEGRRQDQEGRARASETRARNLTVHIQNIESSRFWRLLTLYRRLRGVDDSGRPG